MGILNDNYQNNSCERKQISLQTVSRGRFKDFNIIKGIQEDIFEKNNCDLISSTFLEIGKKSDRCIPSRVSGKINYTNGQSYEGDWEGVKMRVMAPTLGLMGKNMLVILRTINSKGTDYLLLYVGKTLLLL